MNFKGTIILAVVLASLIGYYNINKKHQVEEKNQTEQEKKLFNLSQDKIDSFTYKNDNNKVEAEFSQKNNDWVINKPIQDKADKNNVFSMLDSLSQTSYLEKVEKVSNLSDFGLKDPKIVLELKTKDGNKSLKIGEKTPTNNGLYVMKDKDPNVYLVAENLFSSVNKKLVDLRDKTPLEFEREKVTDISLKNNNGEFSIKKVNSNWELTQPQKYKTDNSKIEELFQKIHDEKVTDFEEDNPKDLKKYGLDKPSMEFRVKTKDNKELKFLFGKDSGSFIYGKNNQKNTVFKLDKNISDKFKASLSDLRDKNILTFNSSKINKVYLESVDYKLTAEKDKDKKWKFINKDSKIKFTETDIQSVIENLSNLKCERFFDKNDFTLGDKVINMTLYGDNEPIKISFGSKTKDNQSQIYFLNSKNQNEGYAINNSITSKILK